MILSSQFTGNRIVDHFRFGNVDGIFFFGTILGTRRRPNEVPKKEIPTQKERAGIAPKSLTGNKGDEETNGADRIYARISFGYAQTIAQCFYSVHSGIQKR